MPRLAELPSISDDFPTEVRRQLNTLANFKALVVDLAVDDLSSEDHMQAEFDPEIHLVEDGGRFADRYTLSHGHYDVKPSEDSIADVCDIDVSVLIPRPTGGRQFELTLGTSLRTFYRINYFEEGFLPVAGDLFTKDFNPLTKVEISDGELVPGIGVSQFAVIRMVTKNVRKAHSRGRLKPAECRCL